MSISKSDELYILIDEMDDLYCFFHIVTDQNKSDNELDSLSTMILETANKKSEFPIKNTIVFHMKLNPEDNHITYISTPKKTYTYTVEECIELYIDAFTTHSHKDKENIYYMILQNSTTNTVVPDASIPNIKVISSGFVTSLKILPFKPSLSIIM